MVQQIAVRGALTVEDVMQAFEVSAATARRDFDELAEQQLVTRTRGGAVAHSVTYDLPLRYKSNRQSDEKRRIGAAAADLVEVGQVVGLNGGTTTSEVGRTLAARTVEDGSLAPFTVVTNALNIANELAVRPQLKIVVVGGVLRPQSFELVGPFAGPVLAGVSIDVTFLGVDGIDPENGAAAHHEGEALINRRMVERSSRVVVVADSSKLGRRAFCTICPPAAVDLLITDTGADAGLLRSFKGAGVEVRTV